jgi:hypothetical protein
MAFRCSAPSHRELTGKGSSRPCGPWPLSWLSYSPPPFFFRRSPGGVDSRALLSPGTRSPRRPTLSAPACCAGSPRRGDWKHRIRCLRTPSSQTASLRSYPSVDEVCLRRPLFSVPAYPARSLHRIESPDSRKHCSRITRRSLRRTGRTGLPVPSATGRARLRAVNPLLFQRLVAASRGRSPITKGQRQDSCH